MKRMTLQEKNRLLLKVFNKVSLTLQKDGEYIARLMGAFWAREEAGKSKWLEVSGTGRTAQKSLTDLFDFLSTTRGTDGKPIEVITLGEDSSRAAFRWDEKKQDFILVRRMF